ncbi:uncharacterized protein LOC110875609 [Helianthus annuus]|uniref:uncharacterized protein LOC110875609 n=1 Tax=Helianthus annuus TaxID=4232 RepID=UPI000B905624|nr:uncharacterized protein LOC110875609 [Helianthus annuus]
MPLELGHSDVFGPVKQASVKGLRYMVTFIDDFSRFTWVYFLKEKSEILEEFKLFKVEAERLTGNHVKCLRSDNGGEYLASTFDKNVVFDENSSWWSENKETLPDTELIKERLEANMVKLTFDDDESAIEVDAETSQDPSPSQERQSPWQTGMSNQRNGTDSGSTTPGPQRSTRVSKPNPRYAANVAITEVEEIEPESYEEACDQIKWNLAMQEEIEAMNRNETWSLVPKPEEARPIT